MGTSLLISSNQTWQSHEHFFNSTEPWISQHLTFIDGLKITHLFIHNFSITQFATWFLYVIRGSSDLFFHLATFPKHLTLSTQAPIQTRLQLNLASLVDNFNYNFLFKTTVQLWKDEWTKWESAGPDQLRLFTDSSFIDSFSCTVETTGEADSLVRFNLNRIDSFLPMFFFSSLPIFTCLYLPGETYSGKSTLLNLILGEQLLPYSVLKTTSTICELRYGDTPKLVVHFKNKKSGDTTKTVLLDEPSEASEQSYLQQITEFVHPKANREEGSGYEKIELFWPHNLLKVRHEQAQ